MAYTFYESDNRVIRYADALAERGDEVDVIALRRQGQSTVGRCGHVRVFRIQRRAVTEKRPRTYLLKILWFFIQSTVLLTYLQLRRRYDIIHVHNVPDFLVFAAITPRLMGARVILDIHDILPELYTGKFGASRGSIVFKALLLVERLACQFSDHVIVSNHLWQDRLSGRSVTQFKCTTLLNYPDIQIFKPLAKKQEQGDGKFIMLYPGTLNEHQGVDIAIRAFSIVKDRMPLAEFHIYGEGPARASLSSLVTELDLEGRVRLMDTVPIEQISAKMGAADVGVVPKRADGFGNEAFSTKILEFMACGVPVIVSKTKVDAHYFGDNVVHFFAPGDIADLATVLLGVYHNHEERLKKARAAREFAVSNSWQVRVGDYRNLVTSLVRSVTTDGRVACG